MSGFKPQVWVTSALTDQDVAAALTLCFSLRRTETSRKVAVITSRKLSTPLKDALHYGFDFIFYLEEDRNTAGLKIEDFAKLTTLTLKPFDKCVFLSSNMLVMKNCDQIFDEYNVTQGFVWTEKGDSSIFMVRPSMETFKVFMGAVLAKNGSRPENYLKTLTNNKTGKTVFLDEKYSRLLSPQNGILLGNENDFYIINLIDYPNLLEINMSTDGLGLVAQVVLEHLKSIYKWDVSPLLEWAMNVFEAEGILKKESENGSDSTLYVESGLSTDDFG
ncbi:unnamed protein product [Orchesella dallaii]|uniref:Uncharacterized protein n=1 Tax=Orchesella dallaii TaxID=48710 RepID=A0ABP1Q0Y5_9HEXA